MSTKFINQLKEILSNEVRIIFKENQAQEGKVVFAEGVLMSGDEIFVQLKEMLGDDGVSASYCCDEIEMLIHASTYEQDEVEICKQDLFLVNKYFDVYGSITLRV